MSETIEKLKIKNDDLIKKIRQLRNQNFQLVEKKKNQINKKDRNNLSGVVEKIVRKGRKTHEGEKYSDIGHTEEAQ